MKSLAALLALTLVCLPITARAGDLEVTVRDSAGKPVPDAVVMIYPSSGLPPGPIHFPWAYTVVQKNVQFEPFVLIVPVGASVDFPNQDKVRHHVYSFSQGNRFEIKLYGREEKRSVQFQNAGAVAMGCNIHDRMIGFIRVVDTPFAAKTDAGGVAEVRGLPAGAAKMRLWHPYLRGPKNETEKQVSLAVQGVTRDASTVDLRPPPAMQGMTH